MLRLWLVTALLLRRDAYSKNTYIPAKGCNKVRVHFYFLVEVLLLLLLRAAAAAHNISTEAEVLLFLFWWLRCCCSSLIGRDVLKKIRLVSAFCLIRVRNQSRSLWLGYVLLLLVTAPGSCLHQYWSKERCRLLFLPSKILSFTLRCFGRLSLLLFLAASISVL